MEHTGIDVERGCDEPGESLPKRETPVLRTPHDPSLMPEASDECRRLAVVTMPDGSVLAFGNGAVAQGRTDPFPLERLPAEDPPSHLLEDAIGGPIPRKCSGGLGPAPEPGSRHQRPSSLQKPTPGRAPECATVLPAHQTTKPCVAEPPLLLEPLVSLQPALLPPPQSLPMSLPLPARPDLLQPLPPTGVALVQQQQPVVRVPVLVKSELRNATMDKSQVWISVCLCVALTLTCNPLGLICLIPAFLYERKAAGDYRQKNYARGISRLKMAQTFNIRGCIFATVYGIVLPVLLLVAGIVAPIVIIGNAIQSNSANS